METLSLLTTELTEGQFETISALVKDIAGINLHDGKKELVKARLNKRLRQFQFRSFDEYIDHLRGQGGEGELVEMLDAISTNLTSFFREPGHFDYLNQVILPRMAATAGRSPGRLRIWSAGCSSGEEPYSIAICLREHIPGLDAWDAKILATDLSTRVLGRAMSGLYSEDRLKTVSPQLRTAHFQCVEGRPPRQYKVSDSLRKLTTFARLNLMDPWPMTGPFDVIFCRNVMIYFDKPTQAKLVGRFRDLLGKGGTLLIGHSESLTGVKHSFRYMRPTIYEKV